MENITMRAELRGLKDTTGQPVFKSDIEEMLLTGMVKARLKTEDDDYITDESGNPILTEWPICKCNKD